jgi:hypothetical protein
MVQDKDIAVTIWEALVALYNEMGATVREGTLQNMMSAEKLADYKGRVADLERRFEQLTNAIVPYQHYLPNLNFVAADDRHDLTPKELELLRFYWMDEHMKDSL